MIAFEDGARVQTTDFPYDEVDRAFDEIEQTATPDEIDRCYKVIEKLFLWMWQYSPTKTEGLEIRAAILCWVFLRVLRNKTLEELARGLGKEHKQSIGRWHDDFKKRFPEIKTTHMRHDHHPAKNRPAPAGKGN